MTINNCQEVLGASLLQNSLKIIKLAQERERISFLCDRCLLMQNNICAKGCMAMAEDQTGNPYGNDGECEMRRVEFLQGFVREEGVTNN